MRKLFFLFLIIIIFAIAQASGQEKPSWWNEVDFEVPRKDNVVSQYFYVTDNFLSPAYKSDSPERELLFKKSIIAYTELTRHFTDERDMVTTCMAQYQIAQGYREIGDVPRAKESYEKCLTYEQYVKEPPIDKADFGIIAIIDASNAKLAKLKESR